MSVLKLFKSKNVSKDKNQEINFLSLGKKKIFSKLNFSFQGGLFNLLEALSDKDDMVKGTAEASIIKIADRKPDDTLLVLCEYKKSAQKLQDPLLAVILR